MDIKGLILESNFPELQVLLKGPLQKVWRDGFPVDEQKILQLQFDRYICFVDDMVRRQEWTPEDTEYAARHIESMLNDPTEREMWIHQPPVVQPPWPTYNETHHKQIHVVAKSIGLVGEALTYETRGREEGPRPEVVKNLEAALGEQVPTNAQELQEEELFAS